MNIFCFGWFTALLKTIIDDFNRFPLNRCDRVVFNVKRRSFLISLVIFANFKGILTNCWHFKGDFTSSPSYVDLYSNLLNQLLGGLNLF